MKTNLLLIIILTLLFSCSKKVEIVSPVIKPNKVLLLKVDCYTNTFEGAKEFTFPSNTNTFTIINEYQSPTDFGNIKLIYQELNQTLFEGSIVWLGVGQMNFPQNLILPPMFDTVISNDTLMPSAGFQNVFNPYNSNYDHTLQWFSIQKLSIVRQYLNSNPNATVKMFLYTPSVGIGSPGDWDWIFYLKY